MVFGHGVQTLGELPYLALSYHIALVLFHVAERVDFMHDPLVTIGFITIDQVLLDRNRLILNALPLELTF
jgi:hypothetical protein